MRHCLGLDSGVVVFFLDEIKLTTKMTVSSQVGLRNRLLVKNGSEGNRVNNFESSKRSG